MKDLMGYAAAFAAGAVAVWALTSMKGGVGGIQSLYGQSQAGYGGYGGGYGGLGPYGHLDVAGYGPKNVPTPSRYQLMGLKNFINIKSVDEEWDWNRVPGSNVIMKPAQLLDAEQPMRISGTDGPTPVPYYLIPTNAPTGGASQVDQADIDQVTGELSAFG